MTIDRGVFHWRALHGQSRGPSSVRAGPIVCTRPGALGHGIPVAEAESNCRRTDGPRPAPTSVGKRRLVTCVGVHHLRRLRSMHNCGKSVGSKITTSWSYRSWVVGPASTALLRLLCCPWRPNWPLPDWSLALRQGLTRGELLRKPLTRGRFSAPVFKNSWVSSGGAGKLLIITIQGILRVMLFG